MSELQQQCRIVANDRLAADVFRLTIHAPRIAAVAAPGQFVMVRTADSLDPLLRRPFSIHCRTADDSFSLLFKVVGKGTTLLSKAKAGDVLDVVGPLGQGFDLSGSRPTCLIGGGMGIAPLLFLAQELSCQTHVLLGARNGDELAPLAEAFSALGCATVGLATDDGSLGHRGLVPDLLDAVLPTVGRVCTCGPWPMMRSVAERCRLAGTTCQTSMETHMACGMGACLGCAIPASDGGFVHVCKEGPVFNAEDLAWQR